MKQYHDFLNNILLNGTRKNDRTGTGILSTFGYQMRFNLAEGFPLVTTKKIHLKSVVHELLWFLKGDTNTQYLNDHGVRIWDEWADDDGNLGPVYGHQWRSWPTADGKNIDQLEKLIQGIQHNPNSRRHIVNAWNVGSLDKMALPPCHILFQFYVAGNRLSCQLYQRSADAFLGVPFNIASYSLLTHMIASVCRLEVGEFIWTGGDCHIYQNHFEQVQLQLTRKPYKLPTLEIRHEPASILAFEYDDFKFKDYQHHPTIKGKVAV